MDLMQMPQFGEILETGQKAISDTTKSAVTDTAKIVAGQIGIKNENGYAQNQDLQQAIVNEHTKEMVEDFYAPSGDISNVPTNEQAEIARQQNLARVRKQFQELHQSTYIEPLFSYEQHKKEPSKAEEQAQEEQQVKMQELQIKEKQKKDEGIAKFRAARGTEMRASAG